MKKLSIEEKAKAYDELLVKLQEAKVDDNVCYERYCCVIDNIVPELKESEDERMIRYFKDLAPFDNADELYEKYGFSHKDAIAWLEKQAQKPADKVEQKGMNIVEEDMTPFQNKVFCIIDTTIEEEQGLKQVCDELLRLAHDEIMQNPAWGEEDKNRINRLIAYFEDKESFTAEDDIVYANWLKSLKDRVLPQAKQERSEEDEHRINDTIYFL